MIRTTKIAIVLAACGLLAGCAGGGSAKRQAQHEFNSQYLRFRYPAGWHAHRYQEFSTLSTLIVYLSNQRLHQPCVTHHGTHNTTIRCHQPISRLHPHSILAWWQQDGNPAWTFQRVQGTPIIVGARHAKLQFGTTGCGVGASAGIEATVQIPHIADNWYQFTACIRGPRTAHLEQQARDLLKTVTFVHG